MTTVGTDLSEGLERLQADGADHVKQTGGDCRRGAAGGQPLHSQRGGALRRHLGLCHGAALPKASHRGQRPHNILRGASDRDRRVMTPSWSEWFSHGAKRFVHSGAADACRYNNLTAADVLGHRVRFWRQCVGLAPEPPLRVKGPAVLFVNRRHAGAEAPPLTPKRLQSSQCAAITGGQSVHQQLSWLWQCSGPQHPDAGRSPLLLHHTGGGVCARDLQSGLHRGHEPGTAGKSLTPPRGSRGRSSCVLQSR